MKRPSPDTPDRTMRVAWLVAAAITLAFWTAFFVWLV
jgi:hypothetical protein